MHLSSPVVAPPSNHTDTDPQKLLKRATYVAAHREYFDYLHLLLDRATLPHSNGYLPNLTTMAAMVAELQVLNSTAPWLNGVVLGRFIHRVLPGLLTWHGGIYTIHGARSQAQLAVETTIYRFPEVTGARQSFDAYVPNWQIWTNELDQWQGKNNFES